MALWIDGLPSPFHLPKPDAAWCAAVEAYDPDLRLFPSQKDPCYRLMRVARSSGGMSPKIFEDRMEMLHPDTVIAIQHRLVAVVTVPREATHATTGMVQWLMDHDLRAHGGADRVVDRLERHEAALEAKTDRDIRDEGRQRHLASRIGYQYRTGARVSLVRPTRPQSAATESPFTPPATRTPGIAPVST